MPELAISTTGTLVYARAQGSYTQQSDLIWVDREGNVEEVGTIPISLPHLQLSPDNTQLALEYRDGPVVKISIYDMLDRGIDIELTIKKQEYPGMPIWMPDGKSIAFSHPGAQEGEMVAKQIAGGAAEVPLFRAPGSYLMPRSLSADGRLLAYHAFPTGTKGDIGVFHFGEDGDREGRVFLGTTQSEYNPALSPDGHWLAYVTENEVYVSRYPSGENMRRVSVDGGDAPLWSPDGREIFYQNGWWDKESNRKPEMWARSVTTEPSLQLGEARKLFDGWFLGSDDGGQSYDISRDGKRFLMVRTDERFRRFSEIIVVQNWFEELERLVPAGGEGQ
jgi:Tol biopolymer transport system component